MRKFKIQAVHRPVRTIASSLFTKKKDKIHEYDKAGVVYYHNCTECKERKSDYVGEMHRCWRERLHEHRLIDRKDAKKLHSFKKEEPEQVSAATQDPNVRRSKRLQEKTTPNYAAMHAGNLQFTTEGESPVAEHVTKIHSKDTIESKILSTEQNYWRRGVKEALAIQKFNPSLNRDDGRHQLSVIYSTLPEYSTRSRPNTSTPHTNFRVHPRTENTTELRITTEIPQTEIPSQSEEESC